MRDRSPCSTDPSVLKDQYLSHLIDRHQFLDFKGMGVSDRVPLRMPLLDMYVPLKARAELPEGETWSPELRLAGRQISEEDAEAVGRKLGQTAALAELLQENDGLVILGDPGSGKTTFLKYLALQLATGPVEALGPGDRLPVLVPLSAYANALSEGDVPLDTFIPDYYRSRGLNQPPDSLLSEALGRGGALLLLDGLDEVRDLQRRHLVVERVDDFFTAQRRRGNKFVLTSRIVGYREVRPMAEGLTECTLVDFEEDDIREFVDKWTAAIEKAARGETSMAREEAARERQELLTAVERTPGVRRLAANPLLLTILALMKRQGVTLPERRVELYEKYIETLLKTWNLARGLDRRYARDLDVVETVRILAPLALWMHETSPGRGLARREEVRRKLEEVYTQRPVDHPDQCARQLLEDVHDHAGLLLERGPGEYGFIHLTFQEYLAATAIAQKGQEDVDSVVELLAGHTGDDDWHEVTLLTVGYFGIIQKRERAASSILRGLLETGKGKPGEALVLAGEVALDIGPTGLTAECRARIVATLTDAVSDDSGIPSILRAYAGRSLGKLGDPRPEVTSVDTMQFCYIPAGPFRMGEDERSCVSRSLARPYWIGRYPVTNAQFDEFVQAGGYRERSYWMEAERRGIWRDGSIVRGAGPAFDEMREERRNKPAESGDSFGVPNHPVVGVNRYECLAFTRWLTQRMAEAGRLLEGWVVRLPTEAEWEKAARGGEQIPLSPLTANLAHFSEAVSEAEGRIVLVTNPRPGRDYPWGLDDLTDRANPSQANYWETRIETTSAVGCFPAGASPYGCEEMSGNVCEWTGSAYESDPRPPRLRSAQDQRGSTAPKETRSVLRGGAYHHDPSFVRCGVRYRFYPRPQFLDVGLRLVLSPFAPGSDPSDL